MARKQKHEEHENHERWLVSYADFITLLFAFFVVMYSVSSVNEGKYRVLSESITASFKSGAKSLAPIQYGKPAKTAAQDQYTIISKPQIIRLSRDIDPQRRSFSTDRLVSNTAANRPGMKQHSGVNLGSKGRYIKADKNASAGAEKKSDESKITTLGQISSEVEKSMKSLVQQGIINIRRHENWLEIEINTGILFYSGSATVSDEALDVLFKLANILAPQPNTIEVEGHTDNQPIHTSVYPSNWELSAARAATVVRMLSDYGVEPRRMQATGFGDNRPLVDNSTEKNRARNRRVILVVNALPKKQPQEDESDILPPAQQLDETILAKDGLKPSQREINVIPPKPAPVALAKPVEPAPLVTQPLVPAVVRKPKPSVKLTEQDFLNSGPYLPGQHPDEILAKQALEEAAKDKASGTISLSTGPGLQQSGSKISTGIGGIHPLQSPFGLNKSIQPIQSPFGLKSAIQLKPFTVPASTSAKDADNGKGVAQ